MNRVRRWLLRLAVLLAVICLLAASWLAFDRWSGRRSWENYRMAAAARGALLTYQECLPPEVPPEENYTTATIFERYRSRTQSDGTSARPFKLPIGPKKNPNKERAEERLEAALAGMREAGWLKEADAPPEPGRAVLLDLERFHTELAELRAARGRTRCHFPQDQKPPPKTEFLSLNVAMDVAAIWALQVDAHLAVGEHAEAREDFLDGVRLYRALTSEPAMICGLVRQAVLTLIRRAVDGGIANRQWRDEDLGRIDNELGSIDVIFDARQSFSTERGFINDASEWQRKESLVTQVQRIEEMDLMGEEPRGWRLWLKAATGESWRNQVNENRVLDLRVADLAAGFGRTFAATMPADVSDEMRFSDMTSMIAKRYVVLEMELRLTRVACALERYRRLRGDFPETLTELVPEFIVAIPEDAMDGKPVRYRRAEPGKFLLYSLGANGRDDGGSPTIDRSISGSFKAQDWVWREPWK